MKQLTVKLEQFHLSATLAHFSIGAQLPNPISIDSLKHQYDAAISGWKATVASGKIDYDLRAFVDHQLREVGKSLLATKLHLDTPNTLKELSTLAHLSDSLAKTLKTK